MRGRYAGLIWCAIVHTLFGTFGDVWLTKKHYIWQFSKYRNGSGGKAICPVNTGTVYTGIIQYIPGLVFGYPVF